MRQFLLTIGIKHQAGIHRRVISRRKIVPRILVGNQNFADIADRVDGSLRGFTLKTVFEIVQGTKTFARVRRGNGIGQQALVNLDRSVLLQIQSDGFQFVKIGLCNALHIVEKFARLLAAVVIVTELDHVVVDAHQRLHIVCDRIRIRFEADRCGFPVGTGGFQRQFKSVVDSKCVGQ